MHNKYAIYCHICKEVELYSELIIQERNFKTKNPPSRSGLPKHHYLPSMVQTYNNYTLLKMSYNFKDHIEQMPETIIYEVESLIYCLQQDQPSHHTPIECGTCNKIDVRQMRNRLRVRLLQHIGDIWRRNTISSVSIHFNGVSGEVNWTSKILAFEMDPFKRLVKEKS